MPSIARGIATTLVCIIFAASSHAVVFIKRQTPDQAAQLAAQAAQLSSMNVPKLAADAAYMASMNGIISSQAAAMGMSYALPASPVAVPTDSAPGGVARKEVEHNYNAPTVTSVGYEGQAAGLPSATTSFSQAAVESDGPGGGHTGSSGPSAFGLQGKLAQPRSRVSSQLQSGGSDFGAQAVQPSPSSPTGTTVLASSASSGGGGGGGSSGGNIGGTDPCKAYVPGGTCPSVFFTFYNPTVISAATGQLGPSYGSCGNLLADTDRVFAFSLSIMQSISTSANSNPMCGKVITITAPGGQTFDATLQDSCEACSTDDHLDLPAEFWKTVTGLDPAVGVARGAFSYTWK